MNAAYREGYDAFKRRLPQSDNPYKEESKKQQWDVSVWRNTSC
jgi:hypothetical protein